MSMIFQEPMTALNPVMTCGDQIDEVLREHTQLAAERAPRQGAAPSSSEVLLPEPERMMASYPHQLSGGQRQRIMIAMALVLEPVLLIADEPTTALDVTTQAQILELMLELQRKHGTGVLFITHDFGVVAEIAHRVAVLRLGDLVEVGSKHDVLQRPQHAYTQMLIGAVPTLRLHARPSDDQRAGGAVGARAWPRPTSTRAGSARRARCTRRRTSTSRSAAGRRWASSANRARARARWRAASCA